MRSRRLIGKITRWLNSENHDPMSTPEIHPINENRKLLLADWVARQHSGQLIRRTNDPYFAHVLNVAKMAAPYALLGYEIGLSHDLLEKTSVRPETLHRQLMQLKYIKDEADNITNAVIELTDVYTKTNYPKTGKAVRKREEARRLITISPAAQTVKYADLYDNICWVVKHDLENAAAYLQRKNELIFKMIAGNPVLREHLLKTLSELNLRISS